MSAAITSSRNRSSPGFTFLEVYVVLFIAVIVLAFAAPIVVRQVARHRLEVAAQGISHNLLLARSRAISTGEPHTLVFDEQNGAYNLFADTDDDGVKGPGEYDLYSEPVSFHRPVRYARPDGSNAVTYDRGSEACKCASFRPDGTLMLAGGSPPPDPNAVYIGDGKDHYSRVSTSLAGRVRIESWDEESAQWK